MACIFLAVGNLKSEVGIYQLELMNSNFKAIFQAQFIAHLFKIVGVLVINCSFIMYTSKGIFLIVFM